MAGDEQVTSSLDFSTAERTISKDLARFTSPFGDLEK